MSTSSAPDFAGLLGDLLPDLSLGGVLGFATALALKTIGKIALVVVGLLFIAIQVLASYDILSVDWLRVQAISEPWLKQSGELLSEWVNRVLLGNLPFAGAFTAGFVLGLRRG